MRRAWLFFVASSACGLFPSLSGLTSQDAAVDADEAEADAGPDVDNYADVRLRCQAGPCRPQIGETCCWFVDATDQCISATTPCTGVADLACYGSAECLAAGQTTCCATKTDAGLPATTCTDLATCFAVSGTALCDRPVDASFGDPTDNVCPSPLACNGTTSFSGYSWRKCQ